jgi:hypothetical protein
MDESTSQIEADLRAGRRQLSRNFDELEFKARQLSDWRTHYRNNPKLLLGIALGGGLILGAVAGRARPSRDEYSPERLRNWRPDGTAAIRQINEVWETLSTALMGVAAAKVMNFVGNIVPGFEEQVHRVQARKRDPVSPGFS